MVLGFFPGVKQLRHEDDHSPPPSSEVKDERSYTWTLPIHLHCMERDNFTFSSNTSTSFGYSLKQGWKLEDTGYVDTVSK